MPTTNQLQRYQVRTDAKLLKNPPPGLHKDMAMTLDAHLTLDEWREMFETGADIRHHLYHTQGEDDACNAGFDPAEVLAYWHDQRQRNCMQALVIAALKQQQELRDNGYNGVNLDLVKYLVLYRADAILEAALGPNQIGLDALKFLMDLRATTSTRPTPSWTSQTRRNSARPPPAQGWSSRTSATPKNSCRKQKRPRELISTDREKREGRKT